MVFMRSKIWIITICLLLISSFVSAQPTVFLPLRIIYQDETGAVWSYREMDESSTLILSAESIPQNAQVDAVLSPNGFYVAVMVRQVVDMFSFTEDDDGKTIGELGYQNVLYVFNLLTSEIVLRYDMLPDAYLIKPFDRDAMLEAEFGVQWSPNSEELVFVRGTSGPVDEYTPNGYGHVVYFDVVTQQLTNLPEIGGTPYDWQWSKNGQYGVYRGIDNFGTGAGYSSSGAYLVDVSDAENISQKQLVACCADVVPVGWLETGEFVYSYFNIMAGAAGLFAYQPDTDSTLTILPIGQDNMDGWALDIHAETGKILVSVYDFPATDPLLEAGLYVYDSISDAQPTLISDVVGAHTFFINADSIYIGDRDMALVYHIDTGEFITDTVVNRFVYPSGYGALFTEGTDGATMYIQNDGGEFTTFTDVLPNALLSYMRFVVVPASVYFIGFMPPDSWDNTGSDVVYIGAIFTGATKQVSVDAGNIILDVTVDFSV